MLVNEFKDRQYECATTAESGSSSRSYYCMYQSDLQSEGKIRGTAVLQAYHYSTDQTGERVGILISIIVAYRVLGFVILWMRR